MNKDQTRYLLKFLKPFDAVIVELVMSLREFAWDLIRNKAFKRRINNNQIDRACKKETKA